METVVFGIAKDYKREKTERIRQFRGILEVLFKELPTFWKALNPISKLME